MKTPTEEVQYLSQMLSATTGDDAPRLLAISKRITEIAAAQPGTVVDQDGGVHLMAARKIQNGPPPIDPRSEAIVRKWLWQPLASSPRDGTVFMAFAPHDQGGFQFCAVWNLDNRLLCMMSGDDYTDKATLWLVAHPLPHNDQGDGRRDGGSAPH